VVQDDAVVVVEDLGLVAELDRPVDAAFADRPGFRVVQADQPAGPVRGLSGQPGAGLHGDPPGADDGGGQLGQRPTQPASSPPVGHPAQRPVAVTQHRGGLGHGGLGQVGQLPGGPPDAALLCSSACLARLRSRAAISRTRQPAVCRRSWIGVRVAPPAACTRWMARTSLPTALASSPESVG
jgi:hypothetical protein